MDPLPRPLAFLLLLVSGWVNRQQQDVIDYLREENRVLRAAHGPRRVQHKVGGADCNSLIRQDIDRPTSTFSQSEHWGFAGFSS